MVILGEMKESEKKILTKRERITEFTEREQRGKREETATKNKSALFESMLKMRYRFRTISTQRTSYLLDSWKTRFSTCCGGASHLWKDRFGFLITGVIVAVVVLHRAVSRSSCLLKVNESRTVFGMFVRTDLVEL